MPEILLAQVLSIRQLMEVALVSIEVIAANEEFIILSLREV
jgi:hypothetical protein